jgi:hypothetical protein
MVRMFGINTVRCKSAAVRNAIPLRIRVMDVVFRAAKETIQSVRVSISPVEKGWNIVFVKDGFCRHSVFSSVKSCGEHVTCPPPVS